MADSNTFALHLAAIDKFSGPMKAFAERMKPLADAARGVTKASADGVSTHARFVQAMRAHATGIAGHFRSAGDALASLRGSMSAFFPMLGALGAGGSLVGLFTLTKSVAEAALAADALQKQVGITGKELGTFSLAARMAGVPADNLGQALTKMQKAMAEAAVGKKDDLKALFDHLKIPLRDARGNVIGVAEALPRLMDAFKATGDQGLRARMASALFEEEGLKLIPMLTQGSEALQRYAAMAAKLNYAAPESEKQALKEFEQGWIELEMAASAFKKEIGSRLAPVLKPILGMVRDWLVAIRSDVATLIVDRVKNLAEAVRKIDIGRVVNDMRRWGAMIRDVMRPLGGWYTVIGAITLALGSPLLLAISSVITIMGALGKALFALGALAWANPILAGVGAVAAAGFALYANWDWVKEQLKPVMEWFRSTADQLVEVWGRVRDFFRDMWETVAGYFTAAWEKIKPIVKAVEDAASAIGLLNSNPSPDAPGPSLPRHEGGPYELHVPSRRGVLPRPRDPLFYGATEAPHGQIDVRVRLENVPPGTQTVTQAAGPAVGRVQTQTNVGLANPAGLGAY